MRRASLTYYNIWVATGDTLACYVEIWSLGTSPLCVSLSTEQGQRHSGVLRLWWDHKRRGTFDSWFLVVAWTCVRIERVASNSRQPCENKRRTERSASPNRNALVHNTLGRRNALRILYRSVNNALLNIMLLAFFQTVIRSRRVGLF